MNILHLLSQNHLTGAEVYAVTLGHEQKKQGDVVHQISNGFFYPSELIKETLPVETKSKFGFFGSVFKLRGYLKKYNIELIHAHSRAASKLAFWAALGTDAAYVSTVHGQQHSSFSKRIFNQYGQFIIAVCENIQTHLVTDFKYRPQRMRVIRNPIDPNSFSYSRRRESEKKILKVGIIGRTTGPKKERTEQAVRALLEFSNSSQWRFEITLVGGHSSDLALLESERKRILETDVHQLNSSVYQQFDFVIGSGRVCMESLISGVPTIAFGEANYIGLVRKALFSLALLSNFGDIDLTNKDGPRLDRKKFELDLQSIFANEISIDETRVLSGKAVTEFSTPLIEARVRRIYQSALFLKKHPRAIPVLMYHKIPIKDIQSQHKIYVLKTDFEKHLQFFQKKGFKTLTFSQLEKFKKGEIDFQTFPDKPLILTFDDGYRDNLENASPLLQKYGFKAQIFLLADPEIQNNSWDASADEPSHEIVSGADRQAWKQSAFEIGSHGFSHKKITQMTAEQALAELRNSKASLEKEFGTPVNVFAFTYGDTNRKMAELADQAGYAYAVNTDTGGFLIEESPWEIFRVNIFPHETEATLRKKTSSWYRRYYYWKRKK